MAVEVVNDIVVGLIVWAIPASVNAFLKARQNEKNEEIEGFLRYLKRDLDDLIDGLQLNADIEDDAAELEQSIRDVGRRAHAIDGVRGMHYLVRLVARADGEKADLYEAKIDKLWNLIGLDRGRMSRKGVWVA